MPAEADVFAVLTSGARVTGVAPDAPVTVLAVRRIGQAPAKVTYEDAAGGTGQRLVYAADLAGLTQERPAEQRRGSNGDGPRFRLAAEALRIRMAVAGAAGRGDPLW